MVYYVRIWGLVRGGGLQEGGPQGKPSEGWFRRPQADGSGEAGAPGGPYAGGLQGVVEANGQRKTPRHSRGGIGRDKRRGRAAGRPPAGRAGERSSPRWRSHRACGRTGTLQGPAKKAAPRWDCGYLGVVRASFRAAKVHSGRWMAREASGSRASGRWASLQVRIWYRSA